MKTFDAERHLPPGWDWENLRVWLGWGHALSCISLFAFLSRYYDARSALYAYTQQLNGTMVLELVPGRIITPFDQLMSGLPWLGFWCFVILMGIQVWRHYRFHTQGTMSIYLMRRLPDKWELHRRCWTVPVLACIAELVLFAVLTGLCWLLYRFATPIQCLPM